MAPGAGFHPAVYPGLFPPPAPLPTPAAPPGPATVPAGPPVAQDATPKEPMEVDNDSADDDGDVDSGDVDDNNGDCDNGDLENDVSGDVGPDGPSSHDKGGSNVQKQYKSIFETLSYMFSDRFDMGGCNVEVPIAQAKLNLNNPAPYLKINPPLQSTWFDPPNRDSPSDSVAYFDSNTKFPTASNLFTKDYPVKPPSRPTNITIVDPLLKELLDAPKMEVLQLDPSLFQPATSNVKSLPQPAVDAIIRKSLLDSLVTRELLEFIHLLFPHIKKELSSQFGKDVECPSLSLMEDLACFASFNNDRSTHTQIAALVNNKLSLRNTILKRFAAPPPTAKILRGLNFAGDQLFGPLPESFSARLQTVTGSSLVCKKTSTYSNQSSSRGGANKRPPPSGGCPPAKQTKTDSNSPSQSQFFRGKPPQRGYGTSKKGRGKR